MMVRTEVLRSILTLDLLVSCIRLSFRPMACVSAWPRLRTVLRSWSWVFEKLKPGKSTTRWNSTLTTPFWLCGAALFGHASLAQLEQQDFLDLWIVMLIHS